MPAARTASLAGHDSTTVQYERLRAEIVGGRIAPGTVLLETVLSERLGVSRTPVREALGRLAQEGVLERVRRGYRVRMRGPKEVLEIYEARIALESTCAAAAANRRTPFDLARLTHIGQQARVTTDPSELRELNAAWHKALRAAAGNDTMVELLDRLDSLLAIYDTSTPGLSDQDTSAAEHDLIVAAITDGAAERARQATIEHLGRARDLRLAELAAGGR